MRSCRSAGVTDFVVVVGFRSDLIAPYLHTLGLELGVRLRVVENHRWELGNGTSALAAEPYVNGAFFVLMADHIFAPEFLERLVERDDGRRACALVVDRDLEEVRDVPEATKVRLSDGRVSAIGKQLTRFDAVDTGVFLCRSGAVRCVARSISFRRAHIRRRGGAIGAAWRGFVGAGRRALLAGHRHAERPGLRALATAGGEGDRRRAC